jgi:hypothetical protein
MLHVGCNLVETFNPEGASNENESPLKGGSQSPARLLPSNGVGTVADRLEVLQISLLDVGGSVASAGCGHADAGFAPAVSF